MTELGSPPSAPRTRSAPARSAHVLELLGGGGAERVAGGHHDRAARRRPAALADLADRGGLADAVDADEQPHVRRARLASKCSVAVGAGEALFISAFERVEQLVGRR